MLLLTEDPSAEEVVVDKLLESLEMRKNGSTHIPTCISSVFTMKPYTLILCCGITEVNY